MTRPQLYTLAAIVIPQLGVWGWWLAWEFFAWGRWGSEATISSTFAALIRRQPWASIGSSIVVAFAWGLVVGHVLEMVSQAKKEPPPGDQPDDGSKLNRSITEP
jgi:hypothetical protein